MIKHMPFWNRELNHAHCLGLSLTDGCDRLNSEHKDIEMHEQRHGFRSHVILDLRESGWNPNFVKRGEAS